MQLKAYIQEPNTNLKLDNSYRAVAVCKETLEDLLEDRIENMPIKLVHVFGLCPFIALVLVWLLIIIALTLYLCAGKLKKKPKLNRQRKSVILSFALISSSRLVYLIILDAFAVHVKISTLHSDLKEIFFDGKLGDYHHLLYHVPEILLSFDVISFFVLLVFVVIAIQQKCRYSRPWDICRKEYQLVESAGYNAAENQAWKDIYNRHYYILALTGFCLLFSVILHAPYIITAYLNDAQHAGSIFIFYTTTTVIEFGLLQFLFNRCLEAGENRDSCDRTHQEDEENGESYDQMHVKVEFRDLKTMIFGAMSAVITALLLYGLTVVIMLYFYFVPTDDSISSVPNQMVVSYQTVIIFVGAYIAYTSIFKKKCSLQEALRDTHDDWKLFTDEEVLTKFYKEMITNFNKIAHGLNETVSQNKNLLSKTTGGVNGSGKTTDVNKASGNSS